MAKKASKGTASQSEIKKINFPGVALNEILPFEAQFPDLRFNLATIAFALCVCSQLRVCSPNIKASDFQRSESINWYIRKTLAKSPQILYIAAAVAIRRTMAEYASDSNTSRMEADFLELCTNISGPASSKGGTAAALSSPERLRKFRRGIMLEVVGEIQAASVYRARKIHPNIELIGPDNFKESLPFTLEEGYEEVQRAFMETAELNPETPTEFLDCFSIPSDNGLVRLEAGLGVTRRSLITPIADLNLPPVDDKTPAWKRMAIQQKLDINKKGV